MSRPPRVFHSAVVSIGQSIIIEDSEAHHLIHVLRIHLDDPVCLFTNDKEFVAKVSQIGRDKVYLSILEENKNDLSTPWKLSLAQAIPKSQKMDWIIEKATELGVEAFYPLCTERVVKRTDRMDRWQKIALSASKQSQRLNVPHILPAQEWNEFLIASKNFNLKLIATLGSVERQTLDQVIKEIFSVEVYCKVNKPVIANEVRNLNILGSSELKIPRYTRDDNKDGSSTVCMKKVILAIGPEGDFSPREVEQALSQGWKAVDLGSLVLRSETAAIAGVAILQHELAKVFRHKG